MSIFKRLHLFDFIMLFICGIATGVFSGGIMNAVNGRVSPDYFYILFYHVGGSPSWTASDLYKNIIWQGLKEGMFFGFVIATVFTSYVFVLSKAACGFVTAAPYLLKIAFIAFMFWIVGGIDGILIANFFPQLMEPFLDLGGTRIDVTKYFWVGGSIYGVYIGSLFGLIGGCILFRRDWHREKNNFASLLN